MKLKLDENLPESLLQALSASDHDVDNVRMENTIGQNDQSIGKAAQQSGRFLITQDLDFSNIRAFAPGTHIAALCLSDFAFRAGALWQLALARPLARLRLPPGRGVLFCSLITN